MRIICSCLLALFALACKNEEKTDTAPATSTIENVNGNVPDTTNSITLDGTGTDQTVDSTRKDTGNRR